MTFSDLTLALWVQDKGLQTEQHADAEGQAGVDCRRQAGRLERDAEKVFRFRGKVAVISTLLSRVAPGAAAGVTAVAETLLRCAGRSGQNSE